MKIFKKALIALMCTLLLVSGFAPAQASDLSTFADHLSDAEMTDFVGSWGLRWVRSSGAVDLHQYGYIDIYPDGKIEANIGSDDAEYTWVSAVEPADNGCLYVPGSGSAGDIYLFLFDGGILGCADTLENPGEIKYFEFGGTITEEPAEDQGIAHVIFDYIGATVSDAAESDFDGKWCAFTCTNDNGDLYPLYLLSVECDFVINGGHAVITYRIRQEETVFESEVVYNDGCAVLEDEAGEPQYLMLCEDDRIALVDDPADPGVVMFFLPADAWEEEMAGIDYDPNPQPGELLPIENLDILAGDWEATHFTYGSTPSPLLPMGIEATLSIEPDGMCITGNGEEFISAEGFLDDGVFVLLDDDGNTTWFKLGENGILVASEDPEDFTMVIYYQRAK